MSTSPSIATTPQINGEALTVSEEQVAEQKPKNKRTRKKKAVHVGPESGSGEGSVEAIETKQVEAPKKTKKATKKKPSKRSTVMGDVNGNGANSSINQTTDVVRAMRSNDVDEDENDTSFMNEDREHAADEEVTPFGSTVTARSKRGPSLHESKEVADLSGVTIVNTVEKAHEVVKLLRSSPARERIHAVDTEVMNIDVKKDSPVGHGIVTCLSIYAGPDLDFGAGPKVWVDTLDLYKVGASDPEKDGQDEGQQVLQIFKEYLEDASILKVWHNYSFDRHVLSNHGINVKGFGGDTMHMARLENAARDKYALEALSADFLGIRKRPMKELFVRPKLKADGTEGKALELPPVDELQRDYVFFREHFIQYSCYDTESTWKIREVLQKKLEAMEWVAASGSEEDGTYTPARNLWEFYQMYWRPFGELLADMESEGIYVKTHDLEPIQERAEKDKAEAVDTFKRWVESLQPGGKYMNIHSAVQKQHLFFGKREEPRIFQVENTDGWVAPNSKTKKAKKKRDFTLYGLGMPVVDTTEKMMPAVSLKVLQKLAGKVEADPPKYGTAYNHFGGGARGEEACRAIHALCKVSAVNIMLNTFIIPLQQQVDERNRIHCSLNLNTETGRLSSRKPNLQNQPALEKDVYKIRQAFAATEGKKLIVADYGQLELRILAHITRCESMLEAFRLGGDFHSRTAMGMYPHVAAAVKEGRVLLEWDSAKEGRAPPLPLLKDAFASERRKAKTLNFSIAYGKTARGLANDWNVSLEEAQQTLEAWYADRPEVKQWQQETIEMAHEHGWTRTLMGRYRPLPGINSRNRAERSHSERAAINTPIQGGAADVVMKAMLNLHAHKRFRELGWRILLQIHDEIIAEGPEESKQEALNIVKETMCYPFQKPLLVDLVVDANIGDNWYEAK